MRIVILCLSPSRGGLELYALDELRQLTLRGHHCLAVVSKNSYLNEVLINEDIPATTLDVSFARLPIFSALKLKKIIEEFNADIVHFHWGKDLYLAALAKVMSGYKVKLVHSRHMNYTRDKKSLFHRWFYNKIDLLLVGTNLLLQLARKHLLLADEKIKCLYLGTPEPENKTENCALLFTQENFAKRRLNIAIFGRIEEGKGQHIVIQAIYKMLAAGKDISLTMIGHAMQKSYQQDLEQSIRHTKANEFIRFKEFLADAASFMPCFDLVILSTHCETFGLVLIEAMRAGVAVVGTNAGGVPEIIEDNVSGLLVEPRSVKSMQAAIEKLYNNPDLRAAFAKAGKLRADKLFSNEVHYPKLEEHLGSVLSARISAS